MTNIEDLRIIFEDSLGSPGANGRLQDGRYKFDYVEEEWQRFLSKQTAAAKLLAMAKEAGARSEHWATKLFPAVQFLFTPDELSRFAALVAAKEREACARLADMAIETDPELCASLLARAANECAEDIAAAIRARGQKGVAL